MTTRKRKRFISIIVVAALLVVEIILCRIDPYGKADIAAFHSLTKQILTEELSNDSLSLHYNLAHPEALGIDETAATLTPYSGNLDDTKTAEAYLSRLRSVHPKTLNQTDRATYQRLEAYLENEIAMAQYPCLSDPLSPVSGIQNELPLLLNEYALRDAEDIQCYFQLLSEIPAYFDGLTLYEQQKASMGNFMSDRACDQVIEYCEDVITQETLWRGDHFLQTGFLDRLQPLIDTCVITQAEADEFSKKNTDLLQKYLLPAYHTLADSLYLLKCNNRDSGLFYRQGGADYYRLLLAAKTGSSKTPEELLDLLGKRYDEICGHILALSDEYVRSCRNTSPEDSDSTEALYEYLLNEPGLITKSADDMIRDLCNRIASDYPELAQNDNDDILSCLSLRKVVPALQDVLAPALYITAPIDEPSQNIIYVNNPEKTTDISLYTTLAHEGFPGHLYQTVYSEACATESKSDPVRCLFHYGGFTEGWALYAEHMAYDYAANLIESNLLSRDAAKILCELYWSDRELQLCLLTMLDIRIHYCGATCQSVTDELSLFGIHDTDVINDIYEYIIDDPCNYPMYYVGYLEILSLKELAREKWQSEYTDFRFHKFLMKYGPNDFDTLRNQLTNKRSFV